MINPKITNVTRYPKATYPPINKLDMKETRENVSLLIDKNVIDVEKENQQIRQVVGFPSKPENLDIEEINNNKTEPVPTNNNIPTTPEPTKEVPKVETEPIKKENIQTHGIITLKAADESTWRKPLFLTNSQIRTTKNNLITFENTATNDVNNIVEKQLLWVQDVKRVQKDINALYSKSIKDRRYYYKNKINIPYKNELINKINSNFLKFNITSKKMQKNEIQENSNLRLAQGAVVSVATNLTREILYDLSIANGEYISIEIFNIYVQNLNTALTAGLSARDIADRAYKQIALKGLIPQQDYRIRSLMRTGSNTSMNLAREEVSKESELLVGFQFTATLDSRVTPQCEALDSTMYRKNDADLDRVRPSNHNGCRSQIIPVMFEDDYKEAVQDYKGNMKGDIQKGINYTPFNFGGNSATNSIIIKE